MNFFRNYSQNHHKNHSVSKRILTDAVFGGLGLVPLILETPHHKINPDGEYIDADKVKSLTKALESDKQRSRSASHKARSRNSAIKNSNLSSDV